MKNLLHPVFTALLAAQQQQSSQTPIGGTQQAQQPAISIIDLSCSHDGGNVYQLKDASYFLPRYGKVGLVGRNGCGKSTLLQILAHSCGPDGSVDPNDLPYFSGTVETGKGCLVSYVEQEPFSDITSDEVLAGDALFGITSTKGGNSGTSRPKTAFEAVGRYKQALLVAESDPDRLADATSYMDSIVGAWQVLAKADEVMTKLDVKKLENMPVCKLSGGEKKRVALSSALVQEPDVLLLDEPTNHLDLVAIRWLSELMEDKKLTLLTVSHDRAFLDEVCNRMIELDRGCIYSYDGNYANFLEQKDERLALEDASYQANKNKLKRELEWMRRQPKARESKQKARQEAFYKLEKATKPRVAEVALKLTAENRRMGGNVIKLKDVSLSFGDRLMLDKFSYDFNRGDKIGIVGGNGVGKSTFLKILTGQQDIDSGEISTGETVVFGTYDQNGIIISTEEQEQTLLEYVKKCVQRGGGSSVPEEEARRLLNKFEFQKMRWNERVVNLSGGERRRLQLLSVITKEPNFLVLDEPTNDIDLDTLQALENYLEEYKGVLCVVSHDRFFTDKVCDHLFIFEGNGMVRDYLGSLSEYASILYDEKANLTSAAEAKSPSTNTGDKKLSYKEEKEKRLGKKKELQKLKREMDSIDKTMEKLRKEADNIQKEIDNSSDEGWSYLADLASKLETANESIDEKEMRWLEIAEVLEAENE